MQPRSCMLLAPANTQVIYSVPADAVRLWRCPVVALGYGVVLGLGPVALCAVMPTQGPGTHGCTVLGPAAYLGAW